MGICRLSGKHNVRRIDILVTPPKNWAAASLYFTGSKELNILMREAAQLKGMRLNEYGLWKLPASGIGVYLEPVETETEQEIFELLGLDYLEPEDRDM